MKRSAWSVESGLKRGYMNCSKRAVFIAEVSLYEKCREEIDNRRE